MGKRKKSSSKPVGPKKREPLATVFTCLFCNHEKAVSVKIERKTQLANLSCKICGQSWQTTTNHLTQPVDVYADWIDACESVAQDAVLREKEEREADQQFSSYASRPGGADGLEEDEDYE